MELPENVRQDRISKKMSLGDGIAWGSWWLGLWSWVVADTIMDKL